MKLVSTTSMQLESMRQWFPDEYSVRIWGGPHFRYPFAKQAHFVEDIMFDKLPSYSLIDGNDQMHAFGQYYNRLQHCHLGRLIVAPDSRGLGYAENLIRELCAAGCKDLGVTDCSLFVMDFNMPALSCYRKLGFVETDYPDKAFDIGECLYMVAPLETVLDRTAA